VGVYLHGLHIAVAEEGLQHPDVDPVFQHVGGEAVPELGSMDRDFAGKTYWRPVSLAAFGYFRARASGMKTSPKPSVRS